MKPYPVIALLLLFAACSPHKLHRRSVVKMDLMIDTAQALQQNGILTTGVNVRLHNGKQKATVGLAKGGWDWWHFNIEAVNSNFSYGKLTYNPREVLTENKPIQLIIKPKNNANYVDTFTIDIPRPQKVTVFFEMPAVISPGIPLKLTLHSRFSNGTEISTTSFNGSFLWNLFDVEYNGKMIKNGVLIPDSKYPFPVDFIEVKVSYKYNPDVKTEIQIPLLYNGAYHLNFDGHGGQQGRDGNDAYGQNGRDGRGGQNGGSGGSGQNGKNVTVYLKSLVSNGSTFLLVRAESLGQVETACINVKGGRVTVSCRGGKGGNGGDGGSGACGADETKELSAGQGGNGGDGGLGGNGGNGGMVMIFGDEEALKHLHCVQIDNGGGAGGNGGDGGRSGRGGSNLNSSFLALLFGTNRGYRGNNGLQGSYGHSGNPPAIHKIDTPTLNNIMGIE